MYAVEIIIGLVLSVLGILVLTYFIYLRITQKYTNLSLLHFSEATATLILGVFHITCAVIIATKMKSSEGNKPGQNTSIFTSRSFNVTQDIFDENNFYNIEEILEENKSYNALEEFIRTNKNQFNRIYYNQLYEPSQYQRSLSMGECNFENIYLKYAMLVSSFIYGLISMVNSALECKDCNVEEKDKTVEKSNEEDGGKVFVKRADNLIEIPQKSMKNRKKIIIQTILSWVIPILYTVIVYCGMKQTFPQDLIVVKNLGEHRPTASELNDIIVKPMNVSNPEQKEEVDEIVDKIYNIVTEAKTSTIDPEEGPYPQIMYDVVNYFNNRSQRALELDCDYRNMPLKLHTLFLFIIGYFGVLFYTKNFHTKLELTGKYNENQMEKLGKYIIAFGVLWLPCVIEIFMRTYIMDYKPEIGSDICLGVGNITRVLANVFNIGFVKNFLKRHTNVIHSA